MSKMEEKKSIEDVQVFIDLTACWVISSDILKYFPIFPRMYDLTWSVKSYFLGKIRNISLSSSKFAHSTISVNKSLIASDKAPLCPKSIDFSYISKKRYIGGSHCKHFSNTLLMSTYNISFCGEIREIFTWILLISVFTLVLQSRLTLFRLNKLTPHCILEESHFQF